MKKVLGSILGIAAPFVFASKASAAVINICPGVEQGQNFSSLCNFDPNNLGSLISKIIVVLLIVAVVIAVFFLIWGGIKWITSGGDKQGVESARNHIIAAIVGLIVAFLAFLIINIIGGLFGISLTNLVLPNLTGK